MKRKRLIQLILILAFVPFCISAQKLIYVLKSKVEVQKWQLSSKAYKQVTYLQGATIELYQGEKLILKTNSDKDGNYELALSCVGNYTVILSAPGFNTRKFSINCNSIVIKNGSADFIPSVDITGYLGYKAIKDVGDLGFSFPTVQMADENNNMFKYGGLKFPVNMNDGELKLRQKFCTCNKLGDIALQNKNYALAKNYYLMASSIMEKEEYPIEQLKKVDEGLSQEMIAERSKQKRSGGNAKAKVVKSGVETRKTVSSNQKSTQKSNTGGRKSLPVLGGK